MQEKTRRRSHWTMLAHRAVSPRLRGQYHRSLHAARLHREAQSLHPPLSVLPPVAVPAPSSAPPSRRSLTILLVAALIPLTLLTTTGVIAINLLQRVDVAKSRVQAPCVACALRGNPDAGDPSTAPNASSVPVMPFPGLGAPVLRPPPLAPNAPLPSLTRKEPFTVLLLGVDTREGDTDPAHSDTIILAYVDPTEKQVNLLSIPRDLRVVQAGNRGMAKITDVYANGDATKYRGVGGVGLVWDTIKLNFQINIDYFAQVNFGGLTKMVDAVGGVTVDNPYPIKDDEYPTPDYQYSRLYFPAGIMHLNGDEALQYARTRHADNDFGRNARQQQVILGLREQAVSQNLAGKAPGIIDALGDSFKTDLPQDQWLPLAGFGRDLGNGGITQLILTDLVYDDPQGGVYYAGIDWAQARARAKQFSPKENLDALSAQAQQGANLKLRTVVENGTTNGGFAKRWSDTLAQAGYGKAGDGYIDAPPARKGKVPRTMIYCFGANEETAQAIAKTLSVPGSAVNTVTKRPGEAPPDTDILILLGDDAHEPDANVKSGTG